MATSSENPLGPYHINTRGMRPFMIPSVRLAILRLHTTDTCGLCGYLHLEPHCFIPSSMPNAHSGSLLPRPDLVWGLWRLCGCYEQSLPRPQWRPAYMFLSNPRFHWCMACLLIIPGWKLKHQWDWEYSLLCTSDPCFSAVSIIVGFVFWWWKFSTVTWVRHGYITQQTLVSTFLCSNTLLLWHSHSTLLPGYLSINLNSMAENDSHLWKLTNSTLIRFFNRHLPQTKS